MKSRYKSGDTLTADDLNEIARNVASMFTGGRGIEVRRTGNRAVVNSTTRQIIPKTQFDGHVFKFSTPNNPLSVFDIGGSGKSGSQIRSFNNNLYALGSQSTTYDRSYAFSNANANFFKLNKQLRPVAVFNQGSEPSAIAFGVSGYSDHVYICGTRSNTWDNATGNATIWKLDESLNVVATRDTGAPVLVHGTCTELLSHSNGVYGCGERNVSSKKVTVYRMPHDLSADDWLWPNVAGDLGSPCFCVHGDASTCYAGGDTNDQWSIPLSTTSASIWKLNGGTGALEAYWNAGSLMRIQTIYFDGANVIAGSLASGALWDGAAGNSATFWLFDASLSYQWHFNTNAQVLTCVSDGTNVYVGGFSSTTWDGAGGEEANLWHFNTSGTLLNAYMIGETSNSISGLEIVNGILYVSTGYTEY